MDKLFSWQSHSYSVFTIFQILQWYGSVYWYKGPAFYFPNCINLS